ncbi:hypothetical protein I5G49_10190 [Pseudomonas aeruginosa]|uniref:Uncharacterized protein n=1 Tax=Pseudomonas aeruginosa TaxID=287 RepID=A0ABD7K1B3_PSEAI|nr:MULTISPECIES: hypothetical protein [Pseudomonas aeruginosa group]MBG7302627.1 hypothetical protein [Pseudomonas aeruginosa]RTR95930.1 hypothetical protein DY932_17855 [Pseudomonas paraeruginosa]RTS44233.1 hypothetical protein DY940_18910 [Pseudomonas aeruginosa]HBP0699492.1 hypothetical protein [Pseudomonas aeruginosa]HBP6436161.1 hypothetical protein [Pseudomonas aeruginosa]
MKQLRVDCELDETYAELYEDALAVAASFLQCAKAEMAHTADLRLHYVITVRVVTPGCWVAYWCKVVRVGETEIGHKLASKFRKSAELKSGDRFTIELPKGKGPTYRAGTFKVLPSALREIALYHERLLGELRKAAHENRLKKRSVAYRLDRDRRVSTKCKDALTAVEMLRSMIAVD